MDAHKKEYLLLLQTLIAIRDKPKISAKKIKLEEWPKVEKIHIKNFKTIKEATISLGQVTILVGPNGSGKSSVLQATHWAARAASYIKPKNTKEVISFDRLDYLPSSQPLSTGYHGELGATSSQPHTSISFIHEANHLSKPTATVKIWAARNRGGISAHIEGGSAVTPFKQRESLITAYIPGLAGMSEKETILAQPLLRRHAASGDAGGVLRNVVLQLSITQAHEEKDAGPKRLAQLNKRLEAIHPGFSINVAFDEREDIHINATYSQLTDDLKEVSARPLENLATGILQVVQIFAYLILFKPKILLVDEPDAHLHPDKQERLIEELERSAGIFGTQVIITTHSPNIIRAASPSTQLVWMKNGEVFSESDASIRTLMGWGALDKKALFFIEDDDDRGIRAILKQWPELNRQITVCKCFGVANLPRQPLIQGLIESNEIRVSLILHRDRDFMTMEEVNLWSSKYENVLPWVTTPVDIEGYFCTAPYLSKLYDVAEITAMEWIKLAAARITKAKDTFLNKRRELVHMLYPNGGSPDANKLWDAAGGQTADTVLGKALHCALKDIVSKKGKDAHLLHNFTIPPNFEIASELRVALQKLLTTAKVS